ncbi:maleylacetoacetate isomerase [Undibacterium oligocarboniphilum]|uniref:Maleylacetoacetate isomerase n=1 Tax=Undibacterium oligocarboniphilum TaxID=666702 RepID=A0A850QR14_9BURK|nr:maleylacetoacetate isomerase [Undibacterium oligocarboniphilum]MBC3871327.1 maleylacetoacetate isomerase [Undibacterium oligocarboniphilum]NVO78824.1 maleylacetoacetate isomerase [Undibacterium oligocarboniphilum]
MKLYGYFRSSASYRVRIGLNLKGLEYEQTAIHLVNHGGEQLSEAYRQINPEALVPALTDTVAEEQVVLTQSFAILEYLDEVYPDRLLLPADPVARAEVRALSLSIACEIHPLNNLRVLKYLTGTLGVSDTERNNWYRHWCESGLAVIEKKLASQKIRGKYCFGDTPGFADCFLIPQIANAQRFKCDLSDMPVLMQINESCQTHPAFIKAMPSNQPDTE